MKLPVLLCAVLPVTAAASPSVVLSQSLMNVVRESAFLSNMAYDSTPNVTGFDFLMNFLQEPDQAILGRRGEYCYVAFRGTTLTWNDWAQNFDPHKIEVCFGVNGTTRDCCTTRHGFYEAYMTSYHERLEYEIRECAKGCINPDECVVFTGHSQGGAVAALAGLHLADLNPYVITFGQPQTIDAPCNLITSERWYRFVNTKVSGSGISYDPVPFIPAFRAGSFGHMIMLSDDDTGVDYIGLDALDIFEPYNGVEAHYMVGTRRFPGYLDRIDAIISYNAFPVRTNGYVAGSPCSLMKECESKLCAKETKYAYSRCVASDCRTDHDCDTGRCESGLCMPKLGSCMSCDEDSDCESGKCPLTLMKCAGKNGLMDDECKCRMDSDCSSGRCEGVSPSICEARLGEGSSCNEHSDCRSGFCDWTLRCYGQDAVAGTKILNDDGSISVGPHPSGRPGGKFNIPIIIIVVVVAVPTALLVAGAYISYKMRFEKRGGYDVIDMDI